MKRDKLALDCATEIHIIEVIRLFDALRQSS